MNDAPRLPDKPEAPQGIVCRRCGCHHFWVIYTIPKGTTIVRRRECRYCGLRITTTERVIG